MEKPGWESTYALRKEWDASQAEFVSGEEATVFLRESGWSSRSACEELEEQRERGTQRRNYRGDREKD